MRNFFTKLFLLVFMIATLGASGAGISIWAWQPNVPAADNMWPDHESTTQMQPTVEVGVQTLKLTFPGSDDSNTVWRLRTGGIISLIGDPGGSGTAQLETLQIGVDDGVVQNGNTIEITFQHEFVEDAYYAVAVSTDAIQMMDEAFYSGLGYDVGGTGDLFVDADWAFRVDDVTDPLMTDCGLGYEIENGDRGVSVTSDEVHICFDEPLSWVGGSNPLAELGKGDIAFYLASNEDLRLPAGEFGGDIVYQIPLGLDLASNGMELTITLGSGLKSAGRGADIWPADADIYLRFISGLLEDKGGNLWAGLTTSPFEDYTPGVDRFWFTTRDATEITVDIVNIDGVTNSTPGHEPIWMNEEFQITLGADDLTWIDDNTPLSLSNAADLIKLELDGVDYSFIVRSFTASGGFTTIKIEPTADFLPANSGQDVNVKVLGGLVRDADLQVVAEADSTFTLGDFMPPVIDASVNNILCTNFDLRAGTDKDAVVYYALIDVDSIGTNWDTPDIADIYRGYNMVDHDNNSATAEIPVYFNHVADPLGGPYYFGVDPNGAVWQADSMNVTSALVSFEHIDDFVYPNHGKEFMVYYFGVDTAASGPYTTDGIPVDGQATAVSMYTVNLTDCLPPEHEWFSEGVNTSNDPLYDDCDDTENIKKQGKWNFKVASGNYVDELHFIDPSLSWDDQEGLIASGVFTLEVSDEDCSATSAVWTEVEIESIVYSNDEVIVTPLNSYPSGGCVQITLQSGTFMDASANPINVELSCTKTAETYCDPQITVFTVETKDLLFPTAPEFADLNGIVALKDGEITVEFNNPMFTPKYDETNSPVLEEISEDPADVNWIGNYIKVRVGDENDASDTSNIVSETLFSYTVTKDAEGGITKVVMAPIAGDLEYESETWYYVEVEELLQDENQRELAWDDGEVWHNNQFVDPHELYGSYPTNEDWCETYTTNDYGNANHYFMKFRTEDKISPELLFSFQLLDDANPGDIINQLYFEETDSASVYCTDNSEMLGIDDPQSVPIGALITEWSQMGFDSGNGYYIEDDPNTLRPYFTLTNKTTGDTLDFDVVVIEIYDPVTGIPPSYVPFYPGINDAILLGFRPFDYPLAEGENYSMSFNPNYQASNPVDPAVGLPEGPVFVDDNGNPLVKNTYVEFSTCIKDPNTCYASTLTVVDGTNDDEFTPDFVVNFEKADAAAISGSTFFEITGGGQIWTATDEALFFAQGGGQYAVPWSAFSPSTPLTDEIEYSFSVNVDAFYTTSNASVTNCADTVWFTTVDTTAPGLACLSPDIDYNVGGVIGVDEPGTYDDADNINPRNPGKITICYNEDVNLIAGKLIKIYYIAGMGGTTLRKTYVAGTDGDWDAATNSWSADIPADMLAYEAAYEVDVEQGFVKDLAGNESDYLTGPVDGLNTWTFATGSGRDLRVADVEPGYRLWNSSLVDTIDPNLPGDAYAMYGTDSVSITEVSIVLTEKAVINNGAAIIELRSTAPSQAILLIPASDFSPVNDTTWTASIDLIVSLDERFNWFIPEGAWAASDDPTDLNHRRNNRHNFLFLDVTPPTAKIWPEDGDTHVAFNTHGYVRFSEPIIADDGSGNTLIVSQQNLKSWIKVTDVADGLLGPDEYVCEFINPERTHVRITFLDEDAPAIGGSTANLIDEHQYTIDVLVTGDGVGDDSGNSNGYNLQDHAGNDLVQPASVTFTVEDITEPMFEAGMCSTTANSVEIRFEPMQNVNPHLPTTRVYPAEGGVVYYVVLPKGATAPTASQLFNQELTNPAVKTETITSAGATVTWDLPESTVATGYNYVIYAVMEDAEVDVYVAPDYGDAWIGDDPIFDAVDYPIAIADIRPAPNKNMAVSEWGFCVCDDDAPLAVSKEWNQDLNVPVASMFTISFDELVELDPDVLSDGTGTGGTVNYANEVRLRRWDNNVSIAISLHQAGDSLVIVPDADLDEETRYYIEIDREVIMDVLDSHCESDTSTCTSWVGCDNDPNHFAGWVGRDNWWFQTTDNTPPVLTDVSPAGDCTPEGTNTIVFTFEEKNEMVINALGGSAANIYVYKRYEYAIPFEIVAANSGVIANPGGGDVWTITYNTLHKYNSEETYEVVWDDSLFTDSAIPMQHKYTIGTTDVIDDGGDAGAPWDMFMFTMEDFVAPTVNWAMVTTLWQGYDGHDDYVWQIENGSGFWNPNDLDPQVPSPKTVNECGDDAVPHKVAFYVWTDEEVNYVDYTNDEDPFFLEVETTPGNWVPVTINVDSSGYGSETLYGDVDVDHNWWVISPVAGVDGSSLEGLTSYRMGINGGELEDATACDRSDDLPGQELFNFCTWDTEPAQAELADGCDIRVTPLDEVVNNIIDECVCEKPYFDLLFDKVVVKTAFDGAQPPVTVPGSPWFTWANLTLNENDLMDTDNGHYISFTDWSGNAVVIDSVTIIQDGKSYRLWLAEPLAERTGYTFMVQDSVLKDVVRVPNGNLFPGRTWTFETKWYTAPRITGTTPMDDAVNVVPTAPLVIMFNRDVTAGEGHIVVRDNGNPQGVVLNIPGTDSRVSISGSVVTISTTGGIFEDNTTYYAEVMANFVYGDHCDAIGFDGEVEQGVIEDEWNWKTGDVDGPMASLYPLYTDECVAPVTDLVLTFDENVYFDGDCAELVIYKATDLNADGSPSNTLFGDVVERINFKEDNFPKLRITGTDPVNGMDRNVITVVPEAAFESGETYYVRVEGNGIDCDTEVDILNDVIGNTWYYPLDSDLPGIHYNDWWFTIAPDDAPMLVAMTPERGDWLEASQLGEGVTTDLVMEFDMNILKGVGTIEVWEFLVNPQGGVPSQQEYKWTEYDVASDDVVVNGNTATISGVHLLDGINWYYVLATPGTFTSDVSCVLTQWEGITNPDVWLFSTKADTTCPVMTTNAITSGAVDTKYLMPESIAFEIAFTENVSVVNSVAPVASIQLAGTTTTVATTTITEAMITDNVITFAVADLSAPLIDQTQYELVILTGAIHDMGTNSLTGSQNPFGQVPVGSENWMCSDIVIPFETGDFTAPVITEFTPTVTCLENENTLVVKFSEPVQDGTGVLTLTDDAGILDDVVLDAANDEDSADSTVTFTVTLPDETNWTVMVDEGFVTDYIYMGVALDGPWDNEPNAAGDWMFGIDDNTVPSLLSWTVTDDKDNDITNLDTTFNIILTYDDSITTADLAFAELTAGGLGVNGLVSVTIDAVDATNVIVEVAGVADQTEYELWLADGFVADDACNANLSLADTARTFIVGDRTAPIVEDYAPIGILGSYIDVEVMVDFFDDSALTAEDSITITNKDNSGVVISEVKWLPVLDADQKATTMPALWFGTVDVVIPEGAVEDVNGNINEEFAWSFSIVDNTAPCLVSVSPADGETCVLENTDLIMNFCDRMDVAEAGQMFHVYELNSASENTVVAHILVTPDMISLDSTVTIKLDATTILPAYNGGLGILKDNQDYTVEAEAGALRDEAGNEWAGIADPTVWNWTTGDNTEPTVVLVPAGSTNDLNNIVVEAQFSEEVVGAETDITVEGAQSYTITMNATNDVATIAIVALDMDTVTVTVPTTITDSPDCNINYLAEEVTGEYVVGDNTRPTMAVTNPAMPDSTLNTLNTFDVTFTFSDQSGGVTGFADALTVDPTAGLVEIDGVDGDLVYTVTLTGDDETDIMVSLDSTMVKDVSMNMNALGADGSWTMTYTVGDHIAPTVAVAPDAATDTTNLFAVAITFSEDVVGVAAGTTVTGGMLDSVVAIDGSNYVAYISGEDHSTIVLAIAATITDDSENANALANPGSWTYTIGDNTPPVVEFINPETATDTINEFDVTITFSEEVVLSADAFTVTGGAIGEITSVYDNQSFQFTLNGEDLATIVLTVSTEITDVAGNNFAGAEYTYTIGDNVAPTVDAVTPVDGDAMTNEFTVDVTFSEEVTNLENGITIDGAPAGDAVVFKEGLTWTVTITGADLEDVVLGVTEAIVDDSNNANPLANPGEWTYTIGDNTPPVVESIMPETATDTVNEFDVTITFNEDVVAGTDAFTVTGGTIGEITTVDSKTFTFTLSGDDKAEVILTVANITDVAGNEFAGATYTYSIGLNNPVPISEIQGDGDGSPIVGEITMIEGTVTAVSDGEGFFVQDANAAWSGIWVEYSEVSLSIGDGVNVVGTVAEISNVTSIVASEVTAADASLVVEAVVLTAPSDVESEMYESVLVQVAGARAGEVSTGTGEWTVYYETTDQAIVNDWLYTASVVEGDFYNVTGVVNGRLDAFKLEPRMAADVVNVSDTNIDDLDGIEFKVYPNPFSDIIKIENHDKLTRVVISNIAGQRVIDIEYPNNEIRTNSLVSGVYVISLITENGIAKTEKIIKK